MHTLVITNAVPAPKQAAAYAAMVDGCAVFNVLVVPFSPADAGGGHDTHMVNTHIAIRIVDFCVKYVIVIIAFHVS